MKVNEIKEVIQVYINRMIVGKINVIYANDYVYIKGYDYNDEGIVYIKKSITDYDTEILDDIKLFIIETYLKMVKQNEKEREYIFKKTGEQNEKY